MWKPKLLLRGMSVFLVIQMSLSQYDDSYGYEDSFEEPEPSEDAKKKMDEAFEKVAGKTPFFSSEETTCPDYPGAVKPCLECPLNLYVLLEWFNENDPSQLRALDTATSILTRYYKNPLTKIALIEVDPRETRRELQAEERRWTATGVDYKNKFKHSYAANLSSAFLMVRKRYLGTVVPEQPDAAILISDGHVIDHEEAVVEADLAREDNVQIFGMELGQKTNLAHLLRYTMDKQRTFPRGEGTVADVGKQIKTMVCHTCCKYRDREDKCPCPEHLTLQILVESSDAMGDAAFHAVRDFLRSFFPLFSKSKVGVAVYGSKVHAVIGLQETPTANEADRLLRTAPYLKGRADTALALRTIGKMNKWTTIDTEFKHLLIFTKGDSSDPVKTMDEAKELQNSKVAIFVVGVGSNTTTELRRLTVGWTERLMMTSHSALENAICQVRNMTCEPIDLPLPVPCPIPMDAVFALDAGLPMDTLNKAKWVVRQVMLYFLLKTPAPVPQRTSILAYAKAVTVIKLLSDRYSVLKADRLLRNSAIPHDDLVDTPTILYKIRKWFMYPKVRGSLQTIVILTNGLNQNVQNIKIEADLARANGLRTVVVAVGEDMDEEVLMAIAGSNARILRYNHCNPDGDEADKDCAFQLHRLICVSKCPEGICEGHGTCPA